MRFFFTDDRKLLDRIRNGDEAAMRYVWEKHTGDLAHRIRKYMYQQPEALGKAEDYAHDAMLILIEQAKFKGAEVLKEEHYEIKWWLFNTAKNLICSAQRNQNKFGNYGIESREDKDDDFEPYQRTTMTESNLPAYLPEDIGHKSLPEVVSQFVAAQPEPLQSLVRFHFMESFSWDEVNKLMEIKFERQTAERYWKDTFWDRRHKEPFINQLIDYCKLYGYELRK